MCKECGTAFSYRNNMMQHVRSIHLKVGREEEAELEFEPGGSETDSKHSISLNIFTVHVQGYG